jgi:DNA-binding NarL/FixJ family response regulator
MDIGLPKIDGIEATARIKEAGLNCKILMFTLRGSSEDVFSALKAGADGYIMKDASPETLVSAIIAVNQGAAWLDPQIARLVLSSINENAAQAETGQDKGKNKYGLTKRELEVLNLIVDGLSNEEISDKLFVSLSTTKAHVHSILQKLYLNDRTQAAVRAIKEGLL